MRLRKLKTVLYLESQVQQAKERNQPVKAKKLKRIRQLRLEGAKPFVFCKEADIRSCRSRAKLQHITRM